MTKRTFTVHESSVNIVGGTYTLTENQTPVNAAKKAARVIFRKIKNDTKLKNKTKITFALREKTRNGSGHVFHYSATIEKLETPITITRNGKETTITTRVHVQAWLP